MPKRGDKHVHISVRVKRAIKKSKKTGIFKLVASCAELYPVSVSNVDSEDTQDGVVTMNVTFEHLGHLEKIASESKKKPVTEFQLQFPASSVIPCKYKDPVFTYTETLTKEQADSERKMRTWMKDWMTHVNK